MPIRHETTISQTQDRAACKEADRRQHLLWAVRHPATSVAGKSGTDGRRTCRKVRHSETDAVELGVGHKDSRHRQIAASCRRSWSYDTNSYASKIIFGKISRKCTLVHIPLLHNVPKCIIISPVINITGIPTLESFIGFSACPARNVNHTAKLGAGSFTYIPNPTVKI